MFKNIEFIKSVTHLDDLPPPELPEIAFLGRSNVGKSSLINAFLNRKRVARVSSTPGFTKAVNFFRVDFKFYVVDLPGYGFAKVPPEIQKQWKYLVEGYLKAIRNFKLLVLIFDIRRKPDQADYSLIRFVTHLKKNYCVVLNKIDTLSKDELTKQVLIYRETLKLPSNLSLFLTSCKRNEGIEPFRKFALSCVEKRS